MMTMSALALRAEQAGLNATAPPQQAMIDGWLIRLSPGRAKRSRCVNALAAGSLPLDALLARCQQSFAAAGLPLILRLTPFSRPDDLDAQLAARGWFSFDAADVMLLDQLPSPAACAQLQSYDAPGYARLIGELRGSSPAEIDAHAERLLASAVPYRGYALHDANQVLLACGQSAHEAGIVGLYDIFTPAAHRGRGHALSLCQALLQLAREEGAHEAYLQVGSDNEAAKRLYARLGFRFGYRYHYRSADSAALTG
jgi:ribosomal protein S18 acetylase RimI-like enzyme